MHPAEALLRELGITDPKEIDLDVLAQYTGAIVRVRQLTDCEARITGHGNRAIISVDSRVAPTRRRFSIAHELGHWYYHRGYVLTCRAAEIGSADLARVEAERIADNYAANLLMPFYLLRPRAETIGVPDWTRVKAIAGEFRTSPLSTAIRIVESDTFFAALVCHHSQGRKWFRLSPRLEGRCFPRTDLDPDSPAFEVLYGGKDQSKAVWGPGKRWFTNGAASNARVQEHTIRSDEESYSLLVIDARGL